MARNDIDPEMLRLIRAAMDTPYPRQERNPGGLIGTIAAILVLLAVTSVIVVFGPALLADRYVPAPVAQPTAAIVVPPNPRPYVVPQQPADVPQAPAQAQPTAAPIQVPSDKGARANLHPLPTLVPKANTIIVYPTAEPQSGGIDLHIGSDGASLNITNDPTPQLAVEYRAESMPEAIEAPNTKQARENEHALDDKGSKPNTRGYR